MPLPKQFKDCFSVPMQTLIDIAWNDIGPMLASVPDEFNDLFAGQPVLDLVYWTKQWQQAYALMQSRLAAANTLSEAARLLMVASQHPLKEGIEPGEEFAARLGKAVAVHSTTVKAGKKLEIFVPASRHRYNGVDDKISTSQAGVNYLQAHGVPLTDIRGEADIVQYRGTDGVYNGADEVYVAAQIYLNTPHLGGLFGIWSQNQRDRGLLQGIANGVVFTALEPHEFDPNAAYHTPESAQWTFLYTLLYDAIWLPNSPMGIKSRAERIPQGDSTEVNN